MATDMSETWYVRIKGKLFGPFNHDQLSAMKRRGQLTSVSEVSTDRRQWSKAGAIPGLFDAPKAPDEGSGAYPVSEPGGVKLSATESTHGANPHDAVVWYYRLQDENLGPVAYNVLRTLAAEGRLSRQTLVWNERLDAWFPAAQVTDLRLVDSASIQEQASGDGLGIDIRKKASSLAGADRSGLDLEFSNEVGTYGVLEPFVQFITEMVQIGIYIVSAQMLKKKAVRWVIGFGLFPLVLTLALSEFQLESWVTMSLLGVYFSLFWAAFFHAILRPTGPVWNRGILWASVVVLIGIPLLFASQEFSLRQSLLKKAFESPRIFDRFVGFTVGVGLPEELVKIMPFFLFALSRKQVIEPRSGLFWGLSCGFGFAIAESVMQYNKVHAARFFLDSIRINELANASLPQDRASAGSAMEGLFLAYSKATTGQLTRFISLPLLHASWSAINGWFIASATRSATNLVPAILVGLLLTSLLHGTYDTFASSSSLGGEALCIASAVISLLLFLAYMSKALDQEAAQQVPPNGG